ncbi:MAG: hypothetical protein EOP18_00025 [Rhizobiaceae bacterium]|nr:MAG: hypothetical protein EOP18_00025 [Rhizobiaceae bacterium]
MSARFMHVQARMRLRQVSASGDSVIFFRRAVHARASRRSAADIGGAVGVEPTACIDAKVVALPARANSNRNFFMD